MCSDNYQDYYRHQFPSLLAWEYKLAGNGWKYIGGGRHRRVIRRGNVVIKIPHQNGGHRANEDEYSLYKDYKNNPDPRSGARYAPCRLLPNGCLMMRYVKESFPNYPPWARELIDGIQVGIDNHGVFMAYDYADEKDFLLEREYSEAVAV